MTEIATIPRMLSDEHIRAACREALSLGLLTTTGYRTNPATALLLGFTTPQNVNDGNPVTEGHGNNVGGGIEVDLGGMYTINRIQEYGHDNNVADGSWQVSIWDGLKWVNWGASFPTRQYSPAPPSGGVATQTPDAVATRFIRCKIVTVDSHVNGSHLGELTITGEA